MRCCGANGPNDWMSSKYNAAIASSTAADATAAASSAATFNIDDKTINMEVSSLIDYYTIPKSCCASHLDEAACDKARRLPIGSPIDGQTLHVHGCMEMLVSASQEYAAPMFVLALCILAVEMLGLIFSLVLCCSINSSDYK